MRELAADIKRQHDKVSDNAYDIYTDQALVVQDVQESLGRVHLAQEKCQYSQA